MIISSYMTTLILLTLKVAFLLASVVVAMAVIFIVFLLAVFLVLITPGINSGIFCVGGCPICNFLFAFLVAVTFVFNFSFFLL